MIAPGKSTTEHARAWRAEVLGAAIAVGGVAMHSWPLAAIGAALVGLTTAAYSLARSSHKAAAARPAPVLANPRV